MEQVIFYLMYLFTLGIYLASDRPEFPNNFFKVTYYQIMLTRSV